MFNKKEKDMEKTKIDIIKKVMMLDSKLEVEKLCLKMFPTQWLESSTWKIKKNKSSKNGKPKRIATNLGKMRWLMKSLSKAIFYIKYYAKKHDCIIERKKATLDDECYEGST